MAADGKPFEPNAPFSLAADWIINDDPLQVKEMSKRLVQRFALVWFYFETTSGGKSSWKRCNPPTENEDALCVAISDEMRWLTGTDECKWFGIICDENDRDRQVVSFWQRE